MAIARRDVGYLSVLVWAFIGIAVKQASVPLVAVSAGIAAALMLALAIFSLLRRRTA
jgi:hypothetical protein